MSLTWRNLRVGKETHLTKSLVAGGLTAYVDKVGDLPSAPFYALIFDANNKDATEELVYISAKGSNYLTIERGKVDTTDIDHDKDSIISYTDRTVTHQKAYDYIDQDVTNGSSPTFANITSGVNLANVVAKTTAYTIILTDSVILCTGTFTVTLPTAALITGKIYHIKNVSTGVITVDGNGSETIDDELAQTLYEKDSLQIISNGSNWVVV